MSAIDPIARKAYNRGWTASANYTVAKDGRTPVERADDRNEPDAWYDGYGDHSDSLAKYTNLKGI